MSEPCKLRVTCDSSTFVCFRDILFHSLGDLCFPVVANLVQSSFERLRIRGAVSVSWNCSSCFAGSATARLLGAGRAINSGKTQRARKCITRGSRRPGRQSTKEDGRLGLPISSSECMRGRKMFLNKGAEIIRERVREKTRMYLEVGFTICTMT